MRLLDCKKELHSLLLQERLAGASLLVFCNKQDLQGALTIEEIREFLELDTFQTRHWAVVPCSAVTGEGLVRGIQWLINDIASRIFMMDQQMRPQLFISGSHSVFRNLSFQEVLMKNQKSPVLFLYRNQKNIVIGRNQNP